MNVPTQQDKPGGGRLRAFLPMLLDVIVPVAVYFVLRGAGLSFFWALTVAGISTGLYAMFNTIRRRKLDFVGVLVILEIALGLGLLVLTNDPRVVAIKPSFYTALAGLYLGFTCFVGRPIVYLAATPIATQGDPVRSRAYELAWQRSRDFRFRQRMMTAVFGIALILEAAARVAVVYHYSPEKLDESFVLSQLPGIVGLVIVLALFRLQVPALRRVVDGIQRGLTTGDGSPARPAA